MFLLRVLREVHEQGIPSITTMFIKPVASGANWRDDGVNRDGLSIVKYILSSALPPTKNELENADSKTVLFFLFFFFCLFVCFFLRK